MNNLIQISRAFDGVYEILITRPKLFEEVPQVIQALRENKSVVLNLTLMERTQAQRAIDFVTGGTYSIKGCQERIGESVFLFTPSFVQVSQGAERAVECTMHFSLDKALTQTRHKNINLW